MTCTEITLLAELTGSVKSESLEWLSWPHCLKAMVSSGSISSVSRTDSR